MTKCILGEKPAIKHVSTDVFFFLLYKFTLKQPHRRMSWPKLFSEWGVKLTILQIIGFIGKRFHSEMVRRFKQQKILVRHEWGMCCVSVHMKTGSLLH